MIRCIYKLGYGLTLYINEKHNHYVVEVYDNQTALNPTRTGREPIIIVKTYEYKYAAELFNKIETDLLDAYV